MQVDFGFQGFNAGSVPPTPIPPDPIPLTFAQAATVNKLLYLPTYTNGTSGVGATLTATQNGVLSDGSATGKIDYNYVAQVGDIILVKNEVSQATNGLYEVINTGSVSTPYQLLRSPENDISAELYPLQVNVLFGLNNALRFFTQVTVNPVIGTSPLVFSVSAQQSIQNQITFVDTATSSALPSCTYASGSNASLPGVGATLTATSNGALGTINGLTAETNSNIVTGFTKLLVKDQADPAQNGTYLVSVKGNSTTPWKLTRLDSWATQFNRYYKYFMVSNTGSTLTGKYYFTQPNNPPLTNATIGTAQINIFEYGGGGTGGYNQIADEGSNLPQRNTINFIGAGVVASDDGTQTNVTIPGGVVVGENYVVVYAGDDWQTNGTELKNAYALAQTLTPNGNAISASNRVTVLCYPGYYDMGGILEVSADYIDIVSITGNCDVRLRDSDGFPIVIKAPNSVFVKGIDTQWIAQPFAISVDTTSNHIFENCKGGDYSFGVYDHIIFGVAYNMGGTFIDCEGGDYSFGSQETASGTFINCKAGNYSFGGSDSTLIYPGDASGTFTNCEANTYSFGVGGNCTGEFINCTAGDSSFAYNCTNITDVYFENCKGEDACFCSAVFPNVISINLTGKIINCTANDESFCYGYNQSNCNINFYNSTGNDNCFIVRMGGANGINADCFNCKAGNYSFGYESQINLVKHNFVDCRGGNYSFSGNNSYLHFNCWGLLNSFQDSTTNNSVAEYENCRGGSNSFGSDGGISSGGYVNCIAGNNSFGGTGGIASGTYINCTAGQESFGGSTGTASGTFEYCIASSDSFASDVTGVLSGKLYWCKMKDTLFNTVSGTGRTFYCVGNDTPNNQ